MMSDCLKAGKGVVIGMLMLQRLSPPAILCLLLSSLTVLAAGSEEVVVQDEIVSTYNFSPDIRVQINAPGELSAKGKKPLLVIYALPNGNSIEQTAGRPTARTNDWRFNIQHIAAQTRFLRNECPDRSIIVAYLEAKQKSWPAWRKQNGNFLIPGILEQVSQKANRTGSETVLNGHSGGGSFIFGYLNAIHRIPDNITRIAFLDSNYAYSREAEHDKKLMQWLENTNHFLCVLAYEDSTVVLNGKPIVSPEGGTWGRSHAMWKDLEALTPLTKSSQGDETHVSGLNGRIQFLLLRNPDGKILHTVQVERNGFIHSMLSGTTSENKGYKYFAEPAYREYIRD